MKYNLFQHSFGNEFKRQYKGKENDAKLIFFRKNIKKHKSAHVLQKRESSDARLRNTNQTTVWK